MPGWMSRYYAGNPRTNDPGPDSVDLARRTNAAIAGVVARHPKRFQAMATLPMSMPKAAARELERYVREPGFKRNVIAARVAHAIMATGNT